MIRLWPYAAGAIAFIALLLAVNHRGYQRGAEDVRAEWGKAQAEVAERIIEQERKNAAETQRRYAAQQDAINAKDREIADARRDAVDAATAGNSLRAQIARLGAACRASSDPGASPGGETARSTDALLSHVQLRLDEAAEGIARHADEASASGRACERSYDALTQEAR